MDNLSKYESRVGRLAYGSKSIFGFITDMRNFKQFIPGDSVSDWQADRESCEFEISPVGKARIKLVDREEFKVVKYEGDGLNNTNFFLWVQLKELAEDDTRVKITIKADLNPMLKMMAAKPIKEFLEKLISGMESFEDWDA